MISENSGDIVLTNGEYLSKYSSEVIKKGLILAKSIHDKSNNIFESTDSASKKIDYIYDQGIINFKIGNIKKSINCFNQALTINPNNFDALYFRGCAYSNIGKEQNCYDDFKKALSVTVLNNNRSVRFLYAKAIIDNLEGNKSNFIDVLSSSPKGNDFHTAFDIFLQGGIYNLLSDKVSAIDRFTRSLKISSDFVLSWLMRGVSYYQIGDQKSAIHDIDKAISINPNHTKNESAYYIRASAYYDLGNRDQALKDINQALTVKPDYLDALWVKGLICYDLREYAIAVDSYTKIIDIEPTNFEAYNRRSTSRLSLGDYQGATEDLEKAKILLTFKT